MKNDQQGRQIIPFPNKRDVLEMDADLGGVNAAWVEALYEDYLQSPDSVPEVWAKRFSAMQEDSDVSRRDVEQRLAQQAERPVAQGPSVDAQAGGVEYPSRALYLIHGYRVHGHLHADLDPLHLNPPPASPELEPRYYGLSEADMDVVFPTGDLVGNTTLPLRDIMDILSRT
ncbi:MAG: hypothetical protein Q9M23_01320, partial [Mariprofundaceae bacterium]|nr:hypothetical protein [Mariprofundaceae bacterium]